MRELTDKVTRTSAAATSGHVPSGSDFSAYLMREREMFTKSVHELNNEQAIIQSLVNAPGNLRGPAEIYSARKLRASESVGSLNYMSHISD